uniref:AlNc14C31G2896 protein n=1 Tax=Albugo laibachii Nc14 TaxID=890382 RepID=F0W7U6_9STRA|nr:AlNc14C31G2896 [Albugo laibachii Nc14]|eukprot:CCA17198.1 AlNc14C31G2896 [Albugo laibachii Nc14]
MKAHSKRVNLDEAAVAAKQASDTTAEEPVTILHPLSPASYAGWTDSTQKLWIVHVSGAPTQYQLAFNPLEDDNEGNSLTCEVTVGNTNVTGNPLYPRKQCPARWNNTACSLIPQPYRGVQV